MLSQATSESFDALCRVVLDRTLSQYEKTAEAKSRELAAKGLYGSGNHIYAIEEIAADSLDRGAAEMFEALIEAHSAEPVGDPTARTRQLQVLYGQHLDVLADGLKKARNNRAQQVPGFRMGQMELNELQNRAERARKQYAAKIQITIAGIANAAPPGGGTTIKVEGPVGAIQTGPNSTANVSQAISNPPDTAAVKAALDALIEALRTARQVPEEKRSEVVELLGDMKVEADKAKPNKSRIAGLLAGAGDVIRTLAAARPAYETVATWVRIVTGHWPSGF